MLVLPENGRWLAQYLTQRLLASVLGHESSEAPLSTPPYHDPEDQRVVTSDTHAGRLRSLDRRMTARATSGRQHGAHANTARQHGASLAPNSLRALRTLDLRLGFGLGLGLGLG